MKRFIITLAALFAGLCAQAQFNLGVKAGYAASWIPGTVVYGYETILPHSDFYAGVEADWSFGRNFFVQGELLYAGKGHSDKSEIDGRYNRNLGYLQIPVFAGIKFGSQDQLSLMIGPEFGVLLFSETKEKGQRYNKTDDCNRFNIALGIQMGYMFNDNIGIDLKFDSGLNRTFKKNTLGLQEDRGHNLSVQLGLLYKFEL